MTNPNNIVRVRARNGGRASVYEANAWAQARSTGLLDGHGVSQNTSADMNVLVGGSATRPDVLIAQNPAGYKIALDVIGQQAVALAAPTSNSRISAIVAYTDDLSLATTQSDVTGSPSSCGLIVVNGTASATPVAPTDAQIREAITADGATGSQAAYCIIATITVSSSTTMITNSLISLWRSRTSIGGVDYMTTNSLLGMPVAAYREQSAGADTELYLVRVGGTVIASGTFVSAGIGQYDDVAIGNIIPVGWRPSTRFRGDDGVWIPFVCTQSAELGQGAWRILPNGTMKFSNAKGFSASRRFAYNAVYITDDNWPS